MSTDYQVSKPFTNGNRLIYFGLLLSVLTSITALVKSVFITGSENGRIEEHIHYIDLRQDRADVEFARRGEIQSEINAIRDIQKQEEANLQEQRRMLEDMIRARR